MAGDRTLEAFFAEVRGSVGEHARRKGYSGNGDGEAFEEGLAFGDEPAHSVGEIRTKLREFLRDPREVTSVKIAGYAFLLWRYCPDFLTRDETISRCVR